MDNEKRARKLALQEIGKIALKGVDKNRGYIFYANEVREVLTAFEREVLCIVRERTLTMRDEEFRSWLCNRIAALRAKEGTADGQ